MKRLTLFLMTIFFANFSEAQDANYESLWVKVTQFERDGLPKSALEVVDEIAVKAKKDKNKPQQIKTLLHKSKYVLILEEDAQLSIINDFKNEIATNKFPVKNILESMLANLYWQYFQQNRWKFYNRTKTSEKVDPSTGSGQVQDFRTWDLETLFNEVHTHFDNSLASGLMLQLESLSNYDTILTLKKDSKTYRPTLFDFLSHNALAFYKTSETRITKPAYKFELDNLDFLADAKTFSKLNITSKDTSSLQLNALKIYQNLIQFHIKDKSPLALVNVNIERLLFINQHAVFSDKQSILLETLQDEKKRLKSHETAGLYDFEIANIYIQQSTQYQPNLKEDFRWRAKNAVTICDAVIEKHPESKAAKKCEVLKSQIERQTLQITTEQFLSIQKDARLLISYKNIDALQFQIFEIPRKQLEAFKKLYRKEEQLEFIKKLKAIKNWDSVLQNEGDYLNHETEILLPKLNNGNYIIFASLKNNDNTFAFSNIQITNMALVENETQTHKTFQIINRNNGSPISNAKVDLRHYHYDDRTYKTEQYTTDSNGVFKIEKKSNQYIRDVSLKIKYENEMAYFGNSYISQYYNPEDEKTQYKTFLFTDRSIYRPGQLVYFKGIVIKTKDNKSEILVNENITVTLHNVNGETVKKLDLTTNEFGSVSGEFTLPNSGLTGNYNIDTSSKTKSIYGAQWFSVEEYKRPKFETHFNAITETFKVNDSVTVTGNALAFAGSNITDAKVVYRVHRTVQYPRWYYWYSPYFNNESQEIAHGETTTNAKGEFEITFKAIPDQSANKNNLPIFNYAVTADVTDLNGETRSTSTFVKVGYHALVANIYIDNFIDKTKKDYNISIQTSNLNGSFIPAQGTVKVYKLKAPNTVLRTRPWAAPDYQNFSEEEFKTLFPHDAYNNEHHPDNWEKGDLVLEKSFDTKKSTSIALDKIKSWQSGKYIITLESKDKYGLLIKDEVKTTLYSHADNTIADNQLFSITNNKIDYKPGENAILTLASAAKDISVTVSIEKNKNIIKTEIIKLNNNKKTISIPVTKNDLGGFIVHYSFTAFNSFISGAQAITVPYPQTHLNIETTTFRNKLQPGIDETWSFKIKGPKGDKVSAELLASMYDASLDQFKSHYWSFYPISNPTYYSYSQSNANLSFGSQNFRVYNNYEYLNYKQQYYDQLNWFGLYFGNQNYKRLYNKYATKSVHSERGDQLMVSENAVAEDDGEYLDKEVAAAPIATNALAGKTPGLTSKRTDEEPVEKSKNDSIENKEKPTFDNIKIRKNLNETAFFFPHLKTDEAGNVSFSFTTPEALTQWRLQLLAHTKNLESATESLTAVTQKELMLTPNAPRFLREGDHITISTKIANLTEKELSGEAKLILTDAISGKDITDKLVIERSQNDTSTPLSAQPFTVSAKGNTQVSWKLSIPDNVQAVLYKVLAKAGDFSDGEQNALPVLSNRMLVTETLPMWIKSNESKTFTLNKLKNMSSTTLRHHKLTLEMTSNPAWYAVQALPYLMEYPYECNEQTFSRYYANALASHIVNSNPRIQAVFNQWKNTDALLSNLEKNEELKSILIKETPWLRDAQSETEQKKRIALLFDLNKMNNELQSAVRKLQNNQMSSGGWPWFKGGHENRWITQHIITGFGHLAKLNVTQSETEVMIKKAIKYLDAQFLKEYRDLRKYNKDVDLNKDHLSYSQLHYLYMRSFYPNISKSKEVEKIMTYYQGQIQKYWLKRPLYAKGLMALVSHRTDDKNTASKILKSLKENSITSEELGMYWKQNTSSWYWYQAPIETQALLIEAFSEAGSIIQSETKNTETIDNLKIWLLKNKQTNRWKTTKATTEAVYALLLQGSDWLSVTEMVDVVIGKQHIEPSKLEDVKVEAGTGYYKTAWSSSEIKPEMAEVKLTKKGAGIAWGSLYWQYFEDLDKVTSAETPLKLKKKLFLKTNTDTGEEITEITNETNLKVGDLVRVRIELRSDRDMEFIHMKDMRAAGLEPVNVISRYKWQDYLGYYESTKDASTDFFFDYLPKGIYVFEYDLRVNNAGNMSNGITTIQSMYAPEFSSHSEGIKIKVN